MTSFELGPGTLHGETEEQRAMRRDAARYEWLRENWRGLLVTMGYDPHTEIQSVTCIQANRVFADCKFDSTSLDRAIDDAMAREDEG